MVKLWVALIIMLWSGGAAYGQVTPGTTSSKTLDGNGNKITSAISGADRGLHIVCLSGCTGGGATQDVNVMQLLGVAPSVTNPFPQRLSTGVAFYDARDRNWTLSSGTDSVAVTNAGLSNLDVLLSTRASEVTLATLLTTTAFQARINTLGQKTMANSTPVVLASDQSSISTLATVSNAFLLDATFTNRFPAGSTPADNESNAVTISRLGTFNYVFDGVAWDRWTGAVSQSGTWNIGTVTTVTTVSAVTAITNTVTTQSATVTLSITGQQAVTTTATALPSNAGREVCIKVVSSGTQTVFYGITGVTTSTGQELLPGEKFCAPVGNSSQFFVIAGGAGSTVAFEVYN